jgi:aspartyl/asparaginyl beta-hydroxylase (cupin superfamily)
MQNSNAAASEIDVLDAQAFQASRSGRDAEAARLWKRILVLDPNHLRTLKALGLREFRRGDMPAARAMFQRIVDRGPADSETWVQLAICCRNLGDEPAEEHAIREALTRDPMDLVALALRANLLDRQGKPHDAARAYGAMVSVAPPFERLHPDLRPAVALARQRIEQYDRERGAFIDRHLDAQFQALSGEDLRRFRESVDILVGRKRRYDSLSTNYHFPGLAPIGFFDRALFPWLDRCEAATDAIRDEFLAVLAAEQGFEPYISYANDVPLNQFAELNNSPRWSAFHLYMMGERVDENAAKCPLTMELLGGAPQPEQPGRTPAAMFSLLKPRTRIPPHTGVSNVRLVVHVPLIIPEECGFRVGNETRQWVPGQAWVFDDTIDHEAWNMSDKLRVILMFDVWNPLLTPPERAMITALSAAMTEFAAGSPASDDNA